MTTKHGNLLTAYARRIREVVVDLAFEDRLVDLVAEGFLCRVFPPKLTS
jgi:hypothetical protein